MATIVKRIGADLIFGGTPLPPPLYGALTAGVGGLPSGGGTAPLSGGRALGEVEAWLRSEAGGRALRAPRYSGELADRVLILPVHYLDEGGGARVEAS